MPLKEYQSTSYPDLQGLLERITQNADVEIFIFFSCTLDKHGDPTTKACFESEDSLMEYTEFVRGSKRSLHLIYFRMQLEDYYVANTEISRDPSLRVSEVPTLLKWKGYQRLTGRQCGKIPLLSMVFEKECHEKFPVYKPCHYFGKPEASQAAGDCSTVVSEPKAVEGGPAAVSPAGSQPQTNDQPAESSASVKAPIPEESQPVETKVEKPLESSVPQVNPPEPNS